MSSSPLPVFCINLDRRPDRWKLFSSQPGAAAASILRHSAVDGKSLDVANDSRISLETRVRILKKTRRAHGEINTPGAIGCTLSHLEVWKRIQKEFPESPFAIVLEDDARIPPDFLENVRRGLATLPEEVDVWLLTCVLYNKQTDPFAAGAADWKSPREFWGTSAYVLRTASIPKLSAQIFPIESHLDRYLLLLQTLGSVKLALHDTIRFSNLSSGTDIQLGACDLCNLPDNLKEENLVLTHKYLLYGLFAYAFCSTLYVALRRNE